MSTWLRTSLMTDSQVVRLRFGPQAEASSGTSPPAFLAHSFLRLRDRGNELSAPTVDQVPGRPTGRIKFPSAGAGIHTAS